MEYSTLWSQMSMKARIAWLADSNDDLEKKLNRVTAERDEANAQLDSIIGYLKLQHDAETRRIEAMAQEPYFWLGKEAEL